MALVERSVLVPYTTAQMFALVNDVPSYPEFLPSCVGASVQERGPNERLATLNIARGPVRTAFTTRNTLTIDREIVMFSTQSPFKHIDGRWVFTPIGAAGSRVSLRVDFKFKNALTALALSSTFESICNDMVDAFASRARKIYG